MNTSVALATIVVGVLALSAACISFFRWVWKQAQNQTKQITAIQQNTEATKGLSASFKTYTDKADGHLMDHEKRLTAVESAVMALLTRMNDFIASISYTKPQ